MTWQDLSSAAALILALVAIYKGVAEGRQSKANLISTYEAGVKLSAERAKQVQEELYEYMDWVDRLCAQIRALGATPVPKDEEE